MERAMTYEGIPYTNGREFLVSYRSFQKSTGLSKSRTVTGIGAQSLSPHSRHEADLRKPFSILIFGLLSSVLLLSSGMVSAGEDSAFSESAYLDEMPVVLSVSRLSQR